MDSKTSLMEFKGSNVTVIETSEGKLWVPVRTLCENLGLSYPTQYRKILTDNKFNHSYIATVASDGKRRKLLCLDKTRIVAWLYSVNSAKLKDAKVKANLLMYQNELSDALHDYATKGIAVNTTMAASPTSNVRELLMQAVTEIDAAAARVAAAEAKSSRIAAVACDIEEQRQKATAKVKMLTHTVAEHAGTLLHKEHQLQEKEQQINAWQQTAKTYDMINNIEGKLLSTTVISGMLGFRTAAAFNKLLTTHKLLKKVKCGDSFHYFPAVKLLDMCNQGPDFFGNVVDQKIWHSNQMFTEVKPLWMWRASSRGLLESIIKTISK